MSTFKIALAALSAVTLLGAPVANAGPNENFAYCELLNNQGFRITDCALFSAIGEGQCAHLDRGRTQQEAMNTSMTMWGFDKVEAAFLLAAALEVYCPSHKGAVTSA